VKWMTRPPARLMCGVGSLSSGVGAGGSSEVSTTNRLAFALLPLSSSHSLSDDDGFSSREIVGDEEACLLVNEAWARRAACSAVCLYAGLPPVEARLDVERVVRDGLDSRR
jgi:hypothetical protein